MVYPVLTNEEMTNESQWYNCFTRNGGNVIPKHASPEAKGSNPTTRLTLLWARNPFRGTFNNWQVSRKTTHQLAEGIMVELWRDFWIRETATGQQVAQLHERYMMMMMMMRLAKQRSAFNLVSRKNSHTLCVSAAFGEQIRMYVGNSPRRIHLKFSYGNCNVPQNVGTYSSELLWYSLFERNHPVVYWFYVITLLIYISVNTII